MHFHARILKHAKEASCTNWTSLEKMYKLMVASGFGFIVTISVIKPDPIDCFWQHDQRIINNNKHFG